MLRCPQACIAGLPARQTTISTQALRFAMSQQMDPQQNPTRNVLRILGPAVVVVGLIFAAIGIGSFFSAFGGSGPPRYFWCAFIGLPLLGLGGIICKFAFLGPVTRYMANEVAPVGKDVVNYMAEGTRGAVRDVAAAVGEGLRAGAPAQEMRILRCHKCNTDNEAPASFCKGCGAPLAKTRPCRSCGELNDPDARFCDGCGKVVD
ncbi:MAG TPA: zinc ribbon domain-containing protein [Planctomycetota bacterium]|nr:zinc ribbon domain-containing protein [Planctomycetota bacterium]